MDEKWVIYWIESGEIMHVANSVSDRKAFYKELSPARREQVTWKGDRRKLAADFWNTEATE